MIDKEYFCSRLCLFEIECCINKCNYYNKLEEIRDANHTQSTTKYFDIIIFLILSLMTQTRLMHGDCDWECELLESSWCVVALKVGNTKTVLAADSSAEITLPTLPLTLTHLYSIFDYVCIEILYV